MSATARRGRSGLAGGMLAAAAAVCAACIPIASPRLPQDVGAALADKPMRRLETDDLLVYYPQGREAEAWRFLTRIEGCVNVLRRMRFRNRHQLDIFRAAS